MQRSVTILVRIGPLNVFITFLDKKLNSNACHMSNKKDERKNKHNKGNMIEKKKTNYKKEIKRIIVMKIRIIRIIVRISMKVNVII